MFSTLPKTNFNFTDIYAFNLDQSICLSFCKGFNYISNKKNFGVFFLLPFPKPQILNLSKLIEFADNNFIFDENGRELSESIENTVGKGEIARYEQFLLFPQYFQKAFTSDT